MIKLHDDCRFIGRSPLNVMLQALKGRLQISNAILCPRFQLAKLPIEPNIIFVNSLHLPHMDNNHLTHKLSATYIYANFVTNFLKLFKTPLGKVIASARIARRF